MSKRAKLLASMAKQAPLLLFVGSKVTASAVERAQYKTHKCTACQTEVAFAEVPNVVPFCPSCGSGCAPFGSDPVPMQPQEELLTSVGCPHCQTQNVVEDRLMDVLAGNMHCGACGNGVAFKATADVSTHPLDGDDSVSDSHDPVDEKLSGKPAAGNDGDVNTSDKKDDVAAAPSPSPVKADTEEEPVDDGADAMDVDVPDAVDEDGDVEVKSDDDGFGEEARLLAFVDGVHAYTLVKANAGDNADLLLQASFHQALQRETAAHGHKVLASYGFTPVKIKLSIGRLVEKRVQAALAGETAKVEASLGDVRDNFEQCAKIAASALTQNFYKHRSNPLKDQLIAQLEGMGVKQAKTVVSRAIAQSGPLFVTAMLELADELMDKSVEHRNELSDSLTQMAPESVNASEEDSESPEADSDLRTSPEEITARLQTPVHTTTREKQTASVTGSAAARLRALKNL